MARYKVTIPVDYVMGHLRYGHLEGVIEADSVEDIKNMDYDEIRDYLDLVVDDYEIDDYGDADLNDMEIKEEK